MEKSSPPKVDAAKKRRLETARRLTEANLVPVCQAAGELLDELTRYCECYAVDPNSMTLGMECGEVVVKFLALENAVGTITPDLAVGQVVPDGTVQHWPVPNVTGNKELMLPFIKLFDFLRRARGNAAGVGKSIPERWQWVEHPPNLRKILPPLAIAYENLAKAIKIPPKGKSEHPLSKSRGEGWKYTDEMVNWVRLQKQTPNRSWKDIHKDFKEKWPAVKVPAKFKNFAAVMNRLLKGAGAGDSVG